MRLYAQLVFALFVLHARAATIPSPAASDLEKKLTEAVKEVLNTENKLTENTSSEQELIDQSNNVKDVENNLRSPVSIVKDVPVTVIVEEVQPVVKTVDEPEKDANNEVIDDEDSSNIKRVEIDLKNPGPPQRQEHETQNPEHFEDQEQTVNTINQNIKDAQNIFNKGLQDITQGVQSWFTNNEQLSSIQNNIQNLQETFTNQFSKLNETVQNFWASTGSNPIQSTPENSETTVTIKNVESGLRILENRFETGVKSLADSVSSLATVREGNATNASSGNAPAGNPSYPLGGIGQYLQLFQNSITQGFNNVTNAIQNYVNQNQQGNNNTTPSSGFFQGFGQGIQNIIGQGQQSTPPAGAQSDEAASSTAKPTIWQGIQSSISNIWRPGQNQPGQQGSQPIQIPGPNGPIAQAIQNNPFVQGVVNLIQPNKPSTSNQPATQKPTEKPAEASADTTQEGSNSVPDASNNDPVPLVKPQFDDKQQKNPEPPVNLSPPNGPIQQIIQRNPLVQGIAGAVQKIHKTITNPERPRDTAEEQEKGVIVIQGGHGGHGGSGSGHNNDSRGIEGDKKPIEEEQTEASSEDKKVVESDKAQASPEIVSDKTE